MGQEVAPVKDDVANKPLARTTSRTDEESSQSVPTSLAASRLSGASSAGRSSDEGSNSFLLKTSLNSSATSSQNGNLERLSSVMGAGSLMRTSVHMMELNQLRFDRTDSAICGRDKEVKALRDAFNRLMARPSSVPDIAYDECAETTAATTSCGVELVLLGGSAGTGKSTIVQHFADKYVKRNLPGSNNQRRRSSAAKSRGMFGKGKFDLRSVGKPYEAFASAFEEICWDILLLEDDSDTEERYMTIQKRLREFGMGIATGGTTTEARSLLDMIPLLIDIIEDTEIDTDTTSNPFDDSSGANLATAGCGIRRFHFLVKMFVRAIGSLDHPCVLFLDDLQWASSSDLDLLKALILDREMEGLLIVGCYRDNEVNPTNNGGSSKHHLTDMIKTVEADGFGIVNMTQLSIGNLDLEAVTTWLEALLSIDRKDNEGVEVLAKIAHSRTGGNAFFVRQFLSSLRDEKLLSYDATKCSWTWDEPKIRAISKATDNVVNLVIQKIDRSLSEDQAIILGVASCLGASFDPRVLAVVMPAANVVEDGGSDQNDVVSWTDRVAACMVTCVEEGILENEESLTGNRRDSLSSKQTKRYRFVHDQIQLAAFDRMFDNSVEDSLAFQGKIGRAIMNNIGKFSGAQSNLFFVAVDLMNSSETYLADSHENLIDLATMNLEAAKRANAASAFESAVRYLRWAVKLLKLLSGVDYWDEFRELTLDIFTLACEVEYTTGNFSECKSLVDEVLGNSSLAFGEKFRPYQALILTLAAEYNGKDSIDVCLDALAQLGVNFPTSNLGMKAAVVSSLLRTKWILKGRDLASLVDSPKMKDEKKIMAMAVMARLQTCCYSKWFWRNEAQFNLWYSYTVLCVIAIVSTEISLFLSGLSDFHWPIVDSNWKQRSFCFGCTQKCEVVNKVWEFCPFRFGICCLRDNCERCIWRSQAGLRAWPVGAISSRNENNGSEHGSAYNLHW